MNHEQDQDADALAVFTGSPSQPESLHQLTLSRAPDVVLEEARRAAAALKDVIDKKPKKVMFNGEQYLEYEDWQMIGRFYNVTAKVVSVEYVEYGAVKGFSAKAVALKNGETISAAEAECLNDEPKWRSRPVYRVVDGVRQRDGEEPVPLFQLKSMAQTRACAKVFRNVLAWIVVLAGYRPTPSEELDAIASPVRTTTEGAEAPSSVPPVPSGVVRVVGIEKKTGISQQTRKPWTNYTIALSDGRSGSTFDEEILAMAKRCQQDNAAVTATFERKGRFSNLTSLFVVPELPLVAASVMTHGAPSSSVQSGEGRPAEMTSVSLVTRVIEMTKGTTKSYGVETGETGVGVYLETSDLGLAKLALSAKAHGRPVTIRYCGSSLVAVSPVEQQGDDELF